MCCYPINDLIRESEKWCSGKEKKLTKCKFQLINVCLSGHFNNENPSLSFCPN